MNARLESKTCISESAQCYHFDFVVEGIEEFRFAPGQFISAVAEDANGKQQTRAYSLAGAPNGNHFELCVNRVAEGFFSNHLADLTELERGAHICIHGPHGHFTLREPITDSILVATGTGVAPMRAMARWLFPADGPDRSGGRQIWLVFGTRHESELYYREEFEEMARRHANFHYLPSLSRSPEQWTGLKGYVQEHVESLVRQRAARLGQPLPAPEIDPARSVADLRFDVYCYICGLNRMVSGVRETLGELGWHRKQIVFERYD